MNEVLGFYITFRSKTMPRAHAYFPTLLNITNHVGFSRMCPVLALNEAVYHGLTKNLFLKSLNKKMRFTNYLKHISGLDKQISPYALRIGGRTWLLNQGLDRQFVDFLGTWKSPEASARYYRAAPQEVLHLLRQFYIKSMLEGRF